MRIGCFTCGKSVSTEVPDETIFRAIATCPECIEKIGAASFAIASHKARPKRRVAGVAKAGETGGGQ